MPFKNEMLYLLERRPAFLLGLLISFVVIFGPACILAYQAYSKAIDATILSNRTSATLLSNLILEHQRAAIGVLQAYAGRPLLVDAIKTRDFEGALGHLRDLRGTNPEMDWPFLSNPDSTVWVNYPVDRQVMNKDLSHRDWYKGVKKEWKPYISSVYKLIVGEKDLAVAVCAPILDEAGKVTGILATAQSTAFFRKIITEAGFNLDAKITLIDQDGHIIYSNGFPYTKEVIAYPPHEFVGKALKGEKGDVEVRDASDGSGLKYVSFAPVEGIGWSVIVEKAKSEVFRSEISYLALIGVAALVIYGFAALSLVRLRERHRQIKELEKLNEELDGRVRERTAEIEARNKALRESEESFRRASELLDAVMKGAKVIVAAQDLDLRYTFFNTAYAEEIKRLTGKDIRVGIRIAQLFADQPDQLAIADREWREVLAGNTTNKRLEFGDPGRHRRVYSILHTPIRDANGRVVGAGEVAYDITEQVRAEETLQQRTLELQQLNETLEARVKGRTEELADLSSQLVSAQENERRRVSYDLHDNVWQTLLAIRSEIENLFSERNLTDRAALLDKAKKIKEALLDMVGKIRSMQGSVALRARRHRHPGHHRLVLPGI